MRKERNKGRSLLELPKDYTIVDLETTGLDPRYDNIIEIACIKYRDGKEIERFQSLVQPPAQEDDGEKYYVDDFIKSLTGITNDMLKDAPNFDALTKDVIGFLSGETLVGHNVNFDINFLYDNLEPYGICVDNDFVDTMRLARCALPEMRHHRLSDLDDYFSIGGSHHRAMGDCEITHDVLLKLWELIDKNHVDLSYAPPRKLSDQRLDLRTLHANKEKFVKDHIFYGKHCVFTGELKEFTRKEAAQIVLDIGGICDNGVTRKTDFLIVGTFEYCPTVRGNKSTKLKKAEDLILKGQDLKILSESIFYDLIKEIPQDIERNMSL